VIGNISFAVPKTYCNLRGENVPQQSFRMFFLLLDSLQILVFHGSQRTLAQLGRDSGPQNSWIERLRQIVISADLYAFRDSVGISVGAQDHDRHVSCIGIPFDDLENLIPVKVGHHQV